MKCCLCLLICWSLLLAGCAVQRKPETPETPRVLIDADVPDESDKAETADVTIQYPQLPDNIHNVEEINELIRLEAERQCKKLTEDSASKIHIQISSTQSYYDNSLLCYLFEGDLYADHAAHPIKIAFSVCVSLENTKLINPTSLFTIDPAFVENMLSHISDRRDDSRFTEDEWAQIVNYFEAMSQAEILKILQSDECVFFPDTDRVQVLFPVPHAIGDYLKLSVSVSYNNV